MMRAIEDGLYETSMKERLMALKNERQALDVDIGERRRRSSLYRRKVAQLEAVLEGPDRAEATDLIRSMIDRVELRPRAEAKGLDAILHGDLAAILAACAGGGAKRKRPGSFDRGASTIGGCGDRI
jgi:site-specific DNA recombinase